MKTLSKIISYIFILILLCGLFPVSVSAANTTDDDLLSEGFRSEPIPGALVDIEEVIRESVSDEVIKERYDMFSIKKPETYRVDRNAFLLEYNVGTDFWGKVTTYDYNGVTEQIDAEYPTVYLPLFGNCEIRSGQSEERVIGHIKLSYDYVQKDYRLNLSLYNLSSEDFRDRRNLCFFESIDDFIEDKKTDARNILMIRYPSSLTDGQEVIALIRTPTDTKILDISNTLYLTENATQDYSVEEYRKLRMEVEKTVYAKSEGWEENPSGGSSGNSAPQKRFDLISLIPYGVIALAIAGTAIFIYLFVRRWKTRSGRDFRN